MKRIFLLVSIGAVLATPSYAWDVTASHGSAASDTGSAAAATARAKGGAGGSATGGAGGSATGGSSSASGGGATVNNNVAVSSGGGHGSGSTRPVSGAFAPSMWGSNPCAGASVSAGAQFVPFGFSFGDAGLDVACQARNAEGSPIAEAVLCRKDRDYRRARADIGRPCEIDAPPKVEAVKATEPAVTAPVPAWCATASEAERRKHWKECSRY